MSKPEVKHSPTDIHPPKPRHIVRYVVLAVMVLLLAGFFGWRALGPSVRVVRLETRTVVETVVASGRILAPARVSLGVQLSGRAKRVAAREGEQVKAGQVLLELDDAELNASLSQARASVAQAAAGVASVEEVGVEVADEMLRQAEVSLRRAQDELDRQRKLTAAGAGTERDLRDAEQALAQAQSQKRAAEARRRDSGPMGAERRRVSAQRMQAEASQRLAQSRLEQSRIVAPADGVLLARDVEPGDVVQAGKVLFVLAPAGEPRVVLQLDEKDLRSVAIGQKALVSAEAATDQRFPAEVSYIAPAIDPLRATVEVRLRIPTPPRFLRPEMTVSVDIRTGEKVGAHVLPIDAVRELSGDKPWVLVVRDGRALRAPVKLGLRGADFVEVVAGVGPDDRVIPETERRAIEGHRVRTSEAR